MRLRWLVLVCLLVSMRTARAQSAEAETLFDDANSLMKQGKVAEACDSFAASNRIEPRAGTLIRLGACREKINQLASAWSAYKDALARAKDPSKRQIAKSKVAELEPKLSMLTVSVPGDSRVDGLAVTRDGQAVDRALWNRPFPVDGGEYVIAARAPGREDWQKSVRVANASANVIVFVPKLAEHHNAEKPVVSDGAKHSTPKQEPASPSTLDEEDDLAAAPTMWTRKRKVAVGIGGLAAIGAVTGIILGRQSKTKQNDALALCPDPKTPCADAEQANSYIQAGRTRAIVADGAFAFAGAAMIFAGVLWFTGAPDGSSDQTAVVPAITPGVTMLAVTGRF